MVTAASRPLPRLRQCGSDTLTQTRKTFARLVGKHKPNVLRPVLCALGGAGAAVGVAGADRLSPDGRAALRCVANRASHLRRRHRGAHRRALVARYIPALRAMRLDPIGCAPLRMTSCACCAEAVTPRHCSANDGPLLRHHRRPFEVAADLLRPADRPIDNSGLAKSVRPRI